MMSDVIECLVYLFILERESSSNVYIADLSITDPCNGLEHIKLVCQCGSYIVVIVVVFFRA